MDSPAEILIVLLVIVLLFAPGRITGLARSLGEAMHEFHRGADEPRAESRESDRGADGPGSESQEPSSASDSGEGNEVAAASPPSAVERGPSDA